MRLRILGASGATCGTKKGRWTQPRRRPRFAHETLARGVAVEARATWSKKSRRLTPFGGGALGDHLARSGRCSRSAAWSRARARPASAPSPGRVPPVRRLACRRSASARRAAAWSSACRVPRARTPRAPSGRRSTRHQRADQRLEVLVRPWRRGAPAPWPPGRRSLRQLDLDAGQHRRRSSRWAAVCSGSTPRASWATTARRHCCRWQRRRRRQSASGASRWWPRRSCWPPAVRSRRGSRRGTPPRSGSDRPATSAIARATMASYCGQRCFGSAFDGGVGIVVADVVHDRLGPAAKRRLARQQLVEQHAGREDVDAVVDLAGRGTARARCSPACP